VLKNWYEKLGHGLGQLRKVGGGILGLVRKFAGGGGSELTSKKMHTLIPVFQFFLLPCSRIGFFSKLPRKGGKRVKT
jgi:hypothetical protein